MKTTYNIQKAGSFDTYVFWDGKGWTSNPSQACQYTSWDLANEQSKKFNSAFIMQSEISSDVTSEKGIVQMPSKKNTDTPKAEETKATGPNKSEQIRELYRSGMSKGDISRKVGVKYQMVRAVILRMEEKEKANEQVAA